MEVKYELVNSMSTLRLTLTTSSAEEAESLVALLNNRTRVEIQIAERKHGCCGCVEERHTQYLSSRNVGEVFDALAHLNSSIQVRFTMNGDMIDSAVASEREACAAVCESLLAYDEDSPGESFAAAVRSRA